MCPDYNLSFPGIFLIWHLTSYAHDVAINLITITLCQDWIHFRKKLAFFKVIEFLGQNNAILFKLVCSFRITSKACSSQKTRLDTKWHYNKTADDLQSAVFLIYLLRNKYLIND
jgi:hypothetical protein